MSGTTPVSKFAQPDCAAQNPAAYKANIDNSFNVAKRIVDMFAPRAQETPDMTVHLDAGAVFDPLTSTLTEIAAQDTTTITAPGSNSRIDRIVIDSSTGSVSVITGTSDPTPSAPAITAGKLPVAQVLLTSASTVITNSMITDERALNSMGVSSLNTGMVMMWLSSTAPTGWLKLNGNSIGSASSGGTFTGTAYQNLYYYFWNNLTDTWAPVAGGRGLSAIADWTANKKLTMPNMADYIAMGVGSNAATPGAQAGSAVGTPTGSVATVIGNTTLGTGSIPSHDHGIPGNTNSGTTDGSLDLNTGSTTTPTYNTATTGGGGSHTHTGSSTFLGDAMPIIPSVTGFYFIVKI